VNDGAALMASPDLRATDTPTPKGRAALGRALGTVLFFAAVGPLIGGAIVGFRDIATVVAAGRDIGTVLYFLIAFGSVGVPAAYAMGLVPAALVGLFFAAVDYGRVRSDPWLAVVVGALGGILWPSPWGQPASMLSSPLAVHIFLASVVSTFICWFLSTRQPRRQGAPPA
jgi:hypothetical protein